jgi:hypothetical protein
MTEERKYYESEKKRKWQRENTVLIGIKLQKKGDRQLLQYIEEKEQQGFSKAGLFKNALLKQMKEENWTAE